MLIAILQFLNNNTRKNFGILVLCIAFCCLIIPLNSFAIKIEGKVMSKGSNSPVSSAIIEVYDGAVLLEDSPHPVGIDGKFEFVLANTVLTHITIRVSAKNYVKVTQTIVLNGVEVAHLGIIYMTALPSLNVGSTIVNQSADRSKSMFDITVSNNSKESAAINKIILAATRKSSTDCLDASKVIVIEINDRLKASEAIIRTDRNPSVDKIAIKGDLEILPCDQMRLKYTIKYGWTLDPGERFKFRIVLPTEVAYLKKKRKIDLEHWAMMNVQFFLDNGEIVEPTTIK